MDERKTILCLAAAMILIACASVHAQSGASNAAALISGSPSYNFGEMDNRKTVEHVFVVRNGGNAPVEITKIFSGCKCASATNEESVVTAGKETAITAKIVLHGREGEQKKSFYVHYHSTPLSEFLGAGMAGHATGLTAGNESDTGVLQLEMTGVAVPWIQIAPGRVDFGNLEKDAKVSREIRVSWKQGLKFAVTNVHVTSKALTSSINAAQPGKISVTTMPPLPPGIIRAEIVAFTDDPSCPKLEIPVIAMALCDIVVVPTELSVGSSSWSSSKYLALRSRSGKAFKILGVEAPDPGIKWVMTPMGAQGYRIELPPPQLSSDIVGEELRIRTDMKDAEELVVPFVKMN